MSDTVWRDERGGMVIVSNITEVSSQPTQPVDDNGDEYVFHCYFDGMSKIVFSNSLEEIVSVFISGYLDMSDADRATARLTYLSVLRASIIDQIVEDLDQDDITDEELDILTSSATSGWGEGSVDTWYHSVPLVILAHNYAPYTDIPQPVSAYGDIMEVGNILVLNALDDDTFIKSLDRTGVAVFYQR